MNSEQRKYNIKSMLKRGDLKLLAKKLDMSYSYLSQAFSPSSKFNFTRELAQKVEQAMGWQKGILDSSRTSLVKPNPGGLQLLALRGRAAKLASFLPNLRVELNQPIRLATIEKMIDIVVYNPDGSIFIIADQSQDYQNPHNVEQLILSIVMTGAAYGVIFNTVSGYGEMPNEHEFDAAEKRSQWFQVLNGKVVESSYGPEGIFDAVGI